MNEQSVNCVICISNNVVDVTVLVASCCYTNDKDSEPVPHTRSIYKLTTTSVYIMLSIITPQQISILYLLTSTMIVFIMEAYTIHLHRHMYHTCTHINFGNFCSLWATEIEFTTQINQRQQQQCSNSALNFNTDTVTSFFSCNKCYIRGAPLSKRWSPCPWMFGRCIICCNGGYFLLNCGCNLLVLCTGIAFVGAFVGLNKIGNGFC